MELNFTFNGLVAINKSKGHKMAQDGTYYTYIYTLRMVLWMVYSLVVRARGLECGSREFKSLSLHLKPETKLREERGLSGCRKDIHTDSRNLSKQIR